MAVRYRSSSVQMNTAGTSQTTITVTKPSQTADGDILIAVTTGPDSAITAPSGWLLVAFASDGTSNHRSALYRKTASSEPADWTWTFGTSTTCGVAVYSIMGGDDILHYSARNTGTSNPSVGREVDAARDSVALHVFSWRDTATATMTGSLGAEKFDAASSNTGATIFRGLAGWYYGTPDLADIVNAGDSIPAASITQSQAVSFGLHWSILVGDKVPDNEMWSSTNGEFDVELNLDTKELDSTGGITSRFRGDITGLLSTSTASTGTAANAHDGLVSSQWTTSAATGWLQYDFGVGVTKTVKRYRITSGSSDTRDPMTWTLQGSNNGTDFTVVDTRTGEAFGQRNEVREFKLNGTAAAYRYYRLDITANASSGADAVIQLAEFRVSDIDVWEDITSFVNEDSKIRITRGLQGSSGRSDFSRAYLELDNTDGRFSLKNQSGKYYGALQRNTKMRISKAYGTKTLQLQGDVRLEGTDMIGDCARTPLRSIHTIAGDMDVRIDAELESWRDKQALCGIAVAPAEVTPWKFLLLDDGRLQLQRSDGTSTFTYTSTLAVPMATRQAVRFTLDVDNGASGSNVIFYYATTIAGSWTQLGSTVTVATTASTSYPGGAVCVGHIGSEAERGIHGLVYHFELYSGIAGTVQADIDFTALTNGAHSWTDSNSSRWITVNNAVVSNRRYRFHGEVSEWPIAWDPTGRWITASATGAGVQKRLERGDAPMSAMRRYHTKGIITDPGAFERFATPAAYWPLEDRKGAFTIASGLPSKPFMTIYGSPTFDEQDGQKFNESDQLIKLGTAKFGGRVVGATSGYADIRWLHYTVTDPGPDITMIEMFGTGVVKRWVVSYDSLNNWRVRGFDENDAGTPAWDSGNRAVTTVGEPMHIQLILDNSGANVAVTFNAFDVYGTSLGSFTDSFLVASVGRITRVNINPDGDANNTYIGHMAVYGFDSPTFAGSELNAHHYETAGARIKRLCQEEEVEFRYIGALEQSAFMGRQDIEDPFPLMSSAAVSDDGYLVDPLDAFGIEYRTDRSLLNQAAHLTVSYSSGDLSGELTPVPDDSYITNDFTANRGDAGSARFQRSDGPLSVNPPPLGVGLYSDSQSYSFAHEGQCVDMASWQVHKGTLDEERYPRLELALENARISASTTKTEALLKLDVGDRVDITDTPDFLPAEDIRQIVIGYEEWFDKFQHNFKLNTIPERIFESARYDLDDRFAEHSSTLYQDISASASTMEVVNETGLPWSSTASDFDVVIDGERITVTAVANVTSSFATDSFNRADSATNLGSTDGGTVLAWQQDAGTWGINGNQAYISVAANGMATISASADFEEVSVTVPTITAGDAFVMFRFSDTSNRWRWGGTVGSLATLQKVVAGATTTYTADMNGTDFTVAAGDTFMVRAHGSVIEVFHNGRLALCVSDTFNSTAIRVGMQIGAQTTTRLDNFSWISSNPRQALTITRGVGPTTGVYHKQGAEVKLYQTPYRGL